MSSKRKIWIGADPGGRGNFGIAILNSNGTARTWCVNCADDAINVIDENVMAHPAGVGVDAPLWWSSGDSSDRDVDQWLRARYGLTGGKVQTANSLRGAALVQGAMFVHRIRELFPDVPVTETHPKAVMVALEGEDWLAFLAQFHITAEINNGQEHERDAIISAVAAREGFEMRWINDLSLTRHATELDPSTYWLAPVHYFWPED